ncbi:MAG: hypothetical protein LUH47_04115, partial [Clostridiales bacterium]|nr:hypothetical protein [Clostridiales bacterium]
STLRVVGGTVASSKCDSTADPRSATGVDGCKTYTKRASENASDGSNLSTATAGGSTSPGSSSGSSTTTTGYDLKLTGSDIGDSTISSTTSYTGSGTSTETNAFKIYAATGKTVTINGSQIRLGGAGNFSGTTPVSRVIAVTLSETGTITLNASNGGTETRTLALSADGSTTLATLAISVGSSGTVTSDTLSAGTYYIYSMGSNLYVTLVGVTYSSSASETTTESTTEGETQTVTETVTEATTETTTETTTEAMFFDDGDDDADYDETTTEITTEAETEEEDDSSTSSAKSNLVWNYTSGENTLGASFSGNAWGSAEDYPLTYDGNTLTAALKMEKSTYLTFTTTADGTLTLVFYSTNSSPTVTVDDTEYDLTTASNLGTGGYTLTLDLKAGSHTVTKGTTNTYLYYAAVELENTTGDVDYDGDVDKADAATVLKINSGIYNSANYDNADYNGDGYVTIIDAILMLRNMKDSGDSSEGTTEGETESTTEGSETTTEASGGSGGGFTWVYETDGYSDLPSAVTISIDKESSGAQATSFSDGSSFSSGLKIANEKTITINTSSAGTITLYMVRNKDNTTGTASVTIDGAASTDLSLSARKTDGAVVSTIDVSAGDTVVITPSGEALLYGITYAAF